MVNIDWDKPVRIRGTLWEVYACSAVTPRAKSTLYLGALRGPIPKGLQEYQRSDYRDMQVRTIRLGTNNQTQLGSLENFPEREAMYPVLNLTDDIPSYLVNYKGDTLTYVGGVGAGALITLLNESRKFGSKCKFWKRSGVFHGAEEYSKHLYNCQSLDPLGAKVLFSVFLFQDKDGEISSTNVYYPGEKKPRAKKGLKFLGVGSAELYENDVIGV